MRLFDVPLHYRFRRPASQKGGLRHAHDLRRHAGRGSNPLMAVTFVDNHDSQPGQSLESWVEPLVQAAGLRADPAARDGYPCLFYGDYFGDQYHDKGRTSQSSRTAC